MTRFPLKPLATLGLLCALSLPVAAAPQTWKINLKDADISALVAEVAEITGKNFIVDPRVKGSITVISSKPLTAPEVYELFLGVLNVNGFAAVPSGRAIKLLPDVNAKQNAVPVDSKGRLKGEELATRVILLDNANAVELVPVLRPMLPQFAHLAAVPSVNGLVVSDRANNIRAVEDIIKNLDAADSESMETIALRETRVDDIVAMLDALSGSDAAAGTPSQGKAGKLVSRVRVLGDARNNRIILKGSAGARQRVREMIASLDTPGSDQFSGVRVFRLRHGSAKQVAEVLRGIVLGDKSSSGGSSLAAASQPGATGSNTAGSGTTAVSGNGISLVADESMNALVVKADPSLMKEIESVIKQLDVRRNQVLIQAAIVEISGDDAKQLGVQWAAGDPRKGVGLVNFSTAGASIVNLAAAIAGDKPELAGIGQGAAIGIGKSETNSNGDRTFYGALIQALSTVTNANLLSTPSILTLDNQEAKIVVGQNVPFITGSTTTTGSGTTNPFQTIERQDVGITLKVIPHIGDGGTVRLEVEQEVSNVVPSTEGVDSADIITNKRSIKTTVLADDSQTVVLGGLIQDDNTRSVAKVPLLGDIPVLGYLFRATSDKKTKKNLLVFLQPTILRDSDSATALSQSQYGQLRSLQLSVSKNGKVSRLPEAVEAIYQGNQPRQAPQKAPVPAQP